MEATTGAKRYGSLTDDVDKFIFVKEGTSAVYGVSFCVVDTAASTILAEVTAIDTYEEASMHKKKSLKMCLSVQGEALRSGWGGRGLDPGEESREQIIRGTNDDCVLKKRNKTNRN